MEYCCLFWVDLGVRVIRFELMFISKCFRGLLLVILFLEEGHHFCYVWYHCDYGATISGEVEVVDEVLVYFPTDELHQTKNFIEHTLIGFFNQAPILMNNKGSAWMTLISYTCQTTVSCFILDNFVCDTWFIVIQDECNGF